MAPASSCAALRRDQAHQRLAHLGLAAAAFGLDLARQVGRVGERQAGEQRHPQRPRVGGEPVGRITQVVLDAGGQRERGLGVEGGRPAALESRKRRCRSDSCALAAVLCGHGGPPARRARSRRVVPPASAARRRVRQRVLAAVGQAHRGPLASAQAHGAAGGACAGDGVPPIETLPADVGRAVYRAARARAARGLLHPRGGGGRGLSSRASDCNSASTRISVPAPVPLVTVIGMLTLMLAPAAIFAKVPGDQVAAVGAGQAGATQVSSVGLRLLLTPSVG